MTCLMPFANVQPLSGPLALAGPPAWAMLPAVTAASASAMTSAPATFRRLLMLSSSSVTGETYALWGENGSPMQVGPVTVLRRAYKRGLLGPHKAHPLVHLFERGP